MTQSWGHTHTHPMASTNLHLLLHISLSQQGQHGSGNGLSPVRRQAITWTNADLLSIGPSGTNFSEIWIKTQNFSFMKMFFSDHLRNGSHFVKGIYELTEATYLL